LNSRGAEELTTTATHVWRFRRRIAVHKTLLIVVVLSLLLAGMVVSEALAGASASQTITIRVGPIDLIGVDPIGRTNPRDIAETDLRWSTNTGESRKVFVRVNHVPASIRSLKVEALTEGVWGKHRQPPVGAGEVTLDSAKQYELISAVQAGAGGCRIRYTVEADPEATVELGNSEVVEVTYILATSDGSPLDMRSHQLIIGRGLPLGEGN
jgi:hypothetical protein